jgi:hypothetical protein
MSEEEWQLRFIEVKQKRALIRKGVRHEAITGEYELDEYDPRIVKRKKGKKRGRR